MMAFQVNDTIFSDEIIEGSEETPSVCSPLFFNNCHLIETVSPTSSCEFSLKNFVDFSTLSRILDDDQYDSDATCLPDNLSDDCQIIENEDKTDSLKSCSKIRKNSLPKFSQDLFIDSHEEENASANSIHASNERADGIGDETLWENIIKPEIQDLILINVEKKLESIEEKLKLSTNSNILNQMLVSIDCLLMELIKISESQNLEKEQLSQSQSLGSRLAKRRTKLKRLIDVSDKLDNNIRSLIKPNTTNCLETKQNELGRYEISRINFEDQKCREAMKTKMVSCLKPKKEEMLETNVIQNSNSESSSQNIRSNNSELQQEKISTMIGIGERNKDDFGTSGHCVSKTSRDYYNLSPALSFQVDGSLFNESGERFSSLIHWLQKQSGNSQVGAHVSPGIFSSGSRVASPMPEKKKIFDLMRFDVNESPAIRMKKCRVMLISEDEVLPTKSFLPDNFWLNDFSQVIQMKDFLHSFNQW